MAVKQISVFIENKEGRIKKAINTLAEENINIRPNAFVLKVLQLAAIAKQPITIKDVGYYIED